MRDQGRAIDILGVEATCKSAYNMVTEMVQVRPFINKASFRISLPAEHKEFIRGKKDGKITRVIKNSGGCGVRVDDDRGSRTVTVVVEHHDASRVLEGVALIEEELPAELAFHLPERYHKQAIGVGGRRIQAIMRRREAYVKFASSEEVARMGGFDVGEVGDNVIVRTPARNARNLELVRHDIEAAVGWAESSGGQNDGFVTVTMRIPRRYHRRMVSRGSVFGKTFGVEDQVDAVSEIEDRTGVRIRFPDRETGTDEVVIEGSQRGVEAAARVLQILIPSVVTMSLPAAAAPVVQSQAFRSNCVVSTALDYDSEVRVFVPSAEETRNAGSPGRSLPSTSSNASLLLKPDGKEEPIEVMIEADEPQRADEIAWLTIAPFLESHGIPLPQRRQPINAATSGLGHFDHRLLVDTVQREREMRERDIMIRAVNEQQHGRMHHDDYGGEDEWRGSGYGRPRDADYYGRRGNEPSPRPRQRQDWDSDAGMQRPSAGANFESWQQARMGYGSPSVSSSPTRSYSQAPRPNTVPRTGPGGPGASGGYANGNALRVNVSGQAPSYGSPRFAPSVPPRGAVPYYPQGPVMSGPHPPIMYFPVGYEPAADTLAVEAQMAAAAAEQQAREIGMTGARDDGQRTPNPEADMARDTSTPSGEAENFDKEGSAGDGEHMPLRPIFLVGD